MARGNDGNILQHWVEAHLASLLLRKAKATTLHIALTHGMKPFEPFEARETGISGFKRLDRWLSVARMQTTSETDPTVVYAYRACKASPYHYPNSAEILAAVVGRSNLQGSITECDPEKWWELSARWNNSSISVFRGSWRQHLTSHGCPERLSYPWLFSMDPMTFVQESARPDDANLCATDLALLKPVLAKYLNSGQPGGVTVFCFSLRKKTGIDRYKLFKSAINSLAGELSCSHGFCEVPLSNPHVGAVLATHDDLIHDIVNEWETQALQ